ncbi:hypothetical protein TNCV_359491 [Trichonephila clavipes]|nr:hypothetical protein TNCV_359491 [Trichonephila clavipes]
MGALNSRRAASPLVSLVEGKERWKASDPSQVVLPLNLGGAQPNRTVTSMVLKAMTNDRRTTSPLATMNFVESVPKPDETNNVIEEVVHLARQISLEVNSDDVQELLDSPLRDVLRALQALGPYAKVGPESLHKCSPL